VIYPEGGILLAIVYDKADATSDTV
jgi:hypothetical protein